MPAAPIRPPIMTSALATPMPTRKASSEDWPDATVIAAASRGGRPATEGRPSVSCLACATATLPARGERLAGKLVIERCAELRRHERADRDRRDQAGDAGDRVVDGRADSRLALVDAREDRGGQRRDGDRQAEREHEDPGEYLGQVIDVDPEAEQHEHSRAGDQRATAHEQARTEAIGERAEPRGQREHDQALGQQRQPGLERRVAGHLLQVQDEEEEQRRQARRIAPASRRSRPRSSGS